MPTKRKVRKPAKRKPAAKRRVRKTIKGGGVVSSARNFYKRHSGAINTAGALGGVALLSGLALRNRYNNAHMYQLPGGYRAGRHPLIF